MANTYMLAALIIHVTIKRAVAEIRPKPTLGNCPKSGGNEQLTCRSARKGLNGSFLV